ncbi:MAG: ribonuclease P protein component [Candidatus Moranbacteria bacterium CG_4_9_14_3_um_filter_40_7]|nr:MAG: ribonuclease P protein component [Candidatus Moranbacteria bacterium CG23_combo_of_CG06-09_8_20_14_all_40_16]PIU80987.1 MAG: ribonuclease P protein component [Candidatus Moranbacteria bacterium CG06_land_8_20_14_3_00_40_12]PJA87828.1 MAG: ribonuclease P protein component [Candidatus Moranbacteria bacterium CG_4_9_14_3_um_filter_40_7]
MLPFNNRLFKKRDFAKVQKMGRFFNSDQISLKVLKNGLDETRIGIIVGKKFSVKAVERNNMKRKLREITRQEIKQIKKGWDVVIMVKESQNKARTSETLKVAIKKILKEAQIINYLSSGPLRRIEASRQGKKKNGYF